MRKACGGAAVIPRVSMLDIYVSHGLISREPPRVRANWGYIILTRDTFTAAQYWRSLGLRPDRGIQESIW